MQIQDDTGQLRVRHARDTLARAGILEGAKNTRVTVRVHDRLLEAARQRSGLQTESELVTAGLALLAAQDDFGAWLVSQRGRLSDDFDIGV